MRHIQCGFNWMNNWIRSKLEKNTLKVDQLIANKQIINTIIRKYSFPLYCKTVVVWRGCIVQNDLNGNIASFLVWIISVYLQIRTNYGL